MTGFWFSKDLCQTSEQRQKLNIEFGPFNLRYLREMGLRGFLGAGYVMG